ncbi:MAG: GNAT family N-acetyltransferase [Acidobacteriota bacterium]
MLADDPLGVTRERVSEPVDSRYVEAFRSIDGDPNQELTVALSEGVPVGMLQLTFIPYLTHTGSWRCQVEGVRIARGVRGLGLGSVLLRWAIDRAKARGARLVQLTSDKSRPDALRFYGSLGFKATHEGFKFRLETPPIDSGTATEGSAEP